MEEGTEYQKERVQEILKNHGIKMAIGGCGCCGSPWVSFEFNGEKITDATDFIFDMFENMSEVFDGGDEDEKTNGIKPPLCDGSGLLKKAYQELSVIASYADDENCPTVGLKMTAKAYKKLCEEIKAAGFA